MRRPGRGGRRPAPAAAGRTPPGPSPLATPRLLHRLVTDRLGLMTGAVAHGDAARLRMGPKTLYVFNSAEAAKHVLADNAANYVKGIGLVQAKRAIGDGLLTSEGELWRTQRALIRPAFRHRRIAEQASVVAEEALALADRLSARKGAGPVDVAEELTGLTLGVLGRTLLDSDLSGFDGIAAAFEAVQDQAMFELVTLSTLPAWVPLPGQLRFRRARRYLEGVVDRLVRERAGRPAGDDVLSALVASAAAEPDPAVGRRRVRDELVTLLLAGHETTASTLSWALHHIDRHPAVGRRLHDEAVSVLGGRAPEAADLTALAYTGRVVAEAMRLHPPVWMLPRQALADDVVAGWRVPAGVDVAVSPYTLHRNPRYWPEPERFDPDRFDPDRTGPAGAAGRPRYAYIPFGAGPRFCVGSQLGTMEAVFVLAVLARDLRLRSVPFRPAVPEPMLSLRVRGGLPMTVHAA